RRSLSLSAMGGPPSHSHLLRQADRVAVYVDVVDGGLEHAAQAELVVLRALDLFEDGGRQRTDPRLERAVAQGHANRDVPRRELAATEDRVERDLQILEVL